MIDRDKRHPEKLINLLIQLKENHIGLDQK